MCTSGVMSVMTSVQDLFSASSQLSTGIDDDGLRYPVTRSAMSSYSVQCVRQWWGVVQARGGVAAQLSVTGDTQDMVQLHLIDNSFPRGSSSAVTPCQYTVQ